MSKKSLSAGLALCIVLSLCSCKKTPENVVPTPPVDTVPSTSENADAQKEPEEEVTFISVMLGDKNIEDWNDNNVIANVNRNSLRLSDNNEGDFSELENTFRELDNYAATSAKSSLHELMTAAKGLSGDDFNPLYLEETSKTLIQRADTKIVSLLEDIFVYSGDIHPDYYYRTTSIDTKTGRILALSDVTANTDRLPDILEAEITDKYGYVKFDENQLSEIFTGYSAEDYNWTLDYQGITFWFSPYDIASYTVGPLSVKLYFDEYPDIIRNEYKTAPSDSYCIMLPKGQKIDFDLDVSDGKKDTLEIDLIPDKFGSYSMLSVTVNGNTFTDEINYAYDFDVYLAHIGDKNYIYSDSWSDNGYHMFSTWDINGEKPRIAEELYNTKLVTVYIEEGENDGAVYKRAFTNPSAFRLEKRVEVLGTREIWANFEISRVDGTPQLTDDEYTFNEGHGLVLKIPMAARVVPDMVTHEVGEGMHLTPCWTDGKTYVDLMTENGWTLRFDIDVSDYPITVNGIPEAECFEELFYAG